MSYEENRLMDKLYKGTHTARWAHKKIVNQANQIQELEKQIEQLKKENEELKDAINAIGESSLSGSGDHSSAPYDCEEIYKICCDLTKDKE